MDVFLIGNHQSHMERCISIPRKEYQISRQYSILMDRNTISIEIFIDVTYSINIQTKFFQKKRYETRAPESCFIHTRIRTTIFNARFSDIFKALLYDLLSYLLQFFLEKYGFQQKSISDIVFFAFYKSFEFRQFRYIIDNFTIFYQQHNFIK